MRAMKAPASLRICADSPDPSLLADKIRTEIYCTGLCLFALIMLHYVSIRLNMVVLMVLHWINLRAAFPSGNLGGV